MKKIAILMLALVLMLCACSNQNTNKEGASQKEASSEAVSGETADAGTTLSPEDEAARKSSVTLPTEESDGELGGVAFGTGDSNNTSTTKKTNDNKETTTSPTSTEDDEGYELPRIPLG